MKTLDQTLMDQRVELLLAEVEEARTTAQYWKAEHLAGNAEIERLHAENDRLTAQITAFKAGWMRVIDTELVITHTGIAEFDDDYLVAKAKLLKLIDWYVSIRTDPLMNGGRQLVPVEPTDEMLKSVKREMSWCDPVGIFNKMLKAAPKPGGSDD